MRDDETLLEYLIRIAKEKGEGLGEGLQQLGVDRLREARPDAARRQGLMPDQLDIVEDTEVPFPPDRPPVFMPEDITSLMSTQDPTPDRASLEAMIAQPRTADPRVLRETINRGVPGMTTNPTTGRTPIEDDLLMSWSGSGQAPLEPSGLMQQDLEQTRARERAQSFDQQVSSSPVTARMPTADIAPRDANLSPEMLAAKEHYEKLQGAKVTEFPSNVQPYEEAKDVDLSSIGDMVIPTNVPQLIAKGVDSFFSNEKIKAGFKRDTGLDVDLFKAGEYRKFFGIGDSKETNTEALNSVISSIDNALKKEDSSKKAPSTEQVEKTVDKALTKKEGKTTFDGHKSKADFFKSMGLTARGKDYFSRMDKIDSEAGMFEIIAMLGGAGNSRAGKNFRDRSYQRLRTEMQMEQRDWDRAYQMYSHPWVTWYDEAGLRDPISRPVGAGEPEGGGWSRGVRPPKDPQFTPQTRVINEIKALYTGEESLDEVMLRLEQSDPMYGMDMEGAKERAANSAKVLLGLDFTPWTPLEKRQVRRLMSEGKVNDVLKWVMEKSEDRTKPYIPYDLKEEFEIFWEANKNKATDSFMEGMVYRGRNRRRTPKKG